MAQLTVADDEGALARSAAERLTTLIERSIAATGNAVVSLTGGSTPRRLYALLGDEAHPWRERIDWARLHLFWGDERCVPPDHPASNFGMARSALLDRVSVPSSQIHRMRGEIADARHAAEDYGGELRAGFAAAGRADLTFDVMLLGLGEDAHVASIFPGSELLRRRPLEGRPTEAELVGRPEAELVGRPTDADRVEVGVVGRPFTGRHELTAAVLAPDLKTWRITLTPSALLDARAIVMLVAGARKAAAVGAAIDGPLDVARCPAQLLRQAGDRVEWMLDGEAAAEIRTGNSGKCAGD